MENWILAVHVVAELIAGLILCFAPYLFNSTGSDSQLETMRNIGNGAICVGLLGAALLSLIKSNRPNIFFGVIAQYHVGVVILQLRVPLEGVPIWPALLFHGGLAIWFTQRTFGVDFTKRNA